VLGTSGRAEVSDALLAVEEVRAERKRVIGVDMTPEML
jgi:hypothetical protein